MGKANKILVIALTCIVSFCLFYADAQAFVWTEVGDAGNLPSTAQIIYGDGSLTAISGNLALNDADMYAFYVPVGSAFSATTVGGASFDTELFLFNSSGFGVYVNDDEVSGSYPQSTLPAGHIYSPSTAGIYYLAISSYDYDPVSPGGEIFPDRPGVPPRSYNVGGPTGPGGGSAISGWSGPGYESGLYTINLTGASGIIPEPATMSLLGLGLLGLLGLKKRKI